MHTRHLNADGTPRHTNRLASQTSPYLQQHAHQPVDWYPWGEEAFETARRADKPIHLSVGYSACHWCHVAAEESFEDEATAQLLNALFVNIKVDREERPDVDRIYQTALQLLTGRPGGWPLTMFLMPADRRPFFGGTYFPREPRHGLPGFSQVARKVAAHYRQQRTQLLQQNDALMAAFANLDPRPAADDIELTDAPIRAAREQSSRNFDARHGGFGRAPKFPHPRMIGRLLRYWQASTQRGESDEQALQMAKLSLQAMADGGIHDQLAGGFSRYSVDERWMIPHFEKMLYDNAELLALYAVAATATGADSFARVAGRIADWTISEMQAPEGGYYSSIDADSEGHEGQFYVFAREEVQRMTGTDFPVVAARFGLDEPPNFEGRWHLYVNRSLQSVAQSCALTLTEVTGALERGCARLRQARERRVRPGRDEKILTSWNALTIRGMAIAGRVLHREDLTASATRALQFIRGTLWRNGRLLATSKDGRAHLNAYLEDHAFLADAILELQQTRFDAQELQFARELLDVLLEHFQDQRDGGFFFTSDDHEPLIHRSKSFGDDSLPDGNGIAAYALQRMGYLLADNRYLQAAQRTVRAAWPQLQNYPQAHASVLDALEEMLQPPQIVVLRGAAAQIGSWQRQLQSHYAPRRLVIAIPADRAALPPALALKVPFVAPDRTTQAPDAIAYLCTGETCSAPMDSPQALERQLAAAQSGTAIA